MIATRNGLAVRLWLLLVAASAACAAAGCGGATPVGSISGKVTLGGTPVSAGVVMLSNQKTGVGVSAELDASGAYQIKSIAAGEYEVAVRPPPPPAPHEMPAAAPAPRAGVPQKYQDPKTSGLKATVKEGANTQDFPL